jgi:hypothetical protein
VPNRNHKRKAEAAAADAYPIRAICREKPIVAERYGAPATINATDKNINASFRVELVSCPRNK